MASVPVRLLSVPWEDLLLGDVLVSSLMALEPVALGSVTVFPGDTFILFSTVSVTPESLPAVCEHSLVLIPVASVAVCGVAKLT